MLDAKKENIKLAKKAKRYTPFWAGLKSVQEVLPLFGPKKWLLKILKNHNFIAFSEEVGGGHFFKKAYVKKRRLLEGQRNDKCFWVL